MMMGKRRTHNQTVKVARKRKEDFDRAINDLIKRGYEVIWQHETGNFAELSRINQSEFPSDCDFEEEQKYE